MPTPRWPTAQLRPVRSCTSLGLSQEGRRPQGHPEEQAMCLVQTPKGAGAAALTDVTPSTRGPGTGWAPPQCACRTSGPTKCGATVQGNGVCACRGCGDVTYCDRDTLKHDAQGKKKPHRRDRGVLGQRRGVSDTKATIGTRSRSPGTLAGKATHLQVLGEEGPQLRLQQLPAWEGRRQ